MSKVLLSLFLSGVVLATMGVRSAHAVCWEECLHAIEANDPLYGEEWCCRVDEGGASELVRRPCHPELDPGGFTCYSYVGKYLEDAGCLDGLGDPVENGQACYETSVAISVKDVVDCSHAPDTCTYGDEYMDSTPEDICWECPSEGPPHD